MGSINPAYLDPATITKIQKHFQENGSVSLQQFFTMQLKASGPFKRSDEPLSHRREEAAVPANLLNALNSPETLTFLRTITLSKAKKVTGRVERYAHRSYALRSPGSGFDVILCLSDWDSVVGGEVAYIDYDGNFEALPMAANTLSIVRRKEGVERFVRYVNNHAGSAKLVLAMCKIG